MTQKWLENTSAELKEKINLLPENFSVFKKELLERNDIVGSVVINNLEDLGWTDHFGFAIFIVTSKVTGNTYKQEYISRRGGRFHSLRGIVLLRTAGKITHFVVRKCDRFGFGEEIFESIGNIYQIEDEFKQDKVYMSTYLENEIAKCLHLPKIKVDQFYDLGNVYTDTSMFNSVVRIFSLVIETKGPDDVAMYTKGKVFDDKQYAYSVEIIPIEKFYEFFGKVADSYLLAIFGRLQALNVIKL